MPSEPIPLIESESALNDLFAILIAVGLKAIIS